MFLMRNLRCNEHARRTDMKFDRLSANAFAYLLTESHHGQVSYSKVFCFIVEMWIIHSLETCPCPFGYVMFAPYFHWLANYIGIHRHKMSHPLSGCGGRNTHAGTISHIFAMNFRLTSGCRMVDTGARFEPKLNPLLILDCCWIDRV